MSHKQPKGKVVQFAYVMRSVQLDTGEEVCHTAMYYVYC